MPKQIVRTDWRDHKVTLYAFAIVLILDFICCFILYASTNQFSSNAWHPEVFFKSLMHPFAYTISEILILTFFRVILLPILVYLGIKFGSTQQAIANAEKEREILMKQQRRDFGDFSVKNLDSTETESLMSQTDDNDSVKLLVDDDTENSSRNNLKINDKSHVEEGSFLSEAEKYAIKKRTDFNKDMMNLLCFLLLMSCEVFTGIKSVLYKFHDNDSWTYSLSAATLCLPVLWMNFELYLSRELILELGKDTGSLFPAVHPHPLYYSDKVAGHWCDLCRKRGLREAYRCNDCDFDLCVTCTRRKNKDRGEGLVRGDSGVKKEWEPSNWEYMKKAITYARPNVWLIVVALVFLLINSGANLLTPNYQGRILDNVIRGDSEGFSRDILIYVGLTVGLGVFGAIRNLCFNIVGQRMGNLVRNQLFSSVIVQDIAFFDGQETGDVTSRILWNTTAMISPVQTLISTLLSSSITLIGGLIMCFYTSWRLSILALTTIGPILLIYRIYAKWSSRINRQIWASLGDANSLAQQALTNIRTVRAFGMEEDEITKFKEATSEALSKGVKDAVASAGTYSLTQLLEYGISVLVLWYGGLVVMNQPDLLTVGKLITFQLYLNMLQSAGTSLSNIVNEFTKAGGAAQRVMSLLQNLPDIDPRAGKVLPEIKGDLTLEDVKFFYQMRPEQQVLKGISLEIKSGQVCALVGKSGGGKSTIIHLLMRFYNPKGGRILLDGVDLSQLNPTWVRKHIGIVAQETQLFNLTVEENIAYGVQDYTREDLIKAAKNANCHDFIVGFEEGYDTRVGERGVRLSGGQKQRIAIARVFLRKPKILFLDEATSSLDAESEGLVQEAIDKLIKTSGCTVVLVAHRLSTVVNADLIGVVHEGKIVEKGSHESLVRQGGVYAKLVQKQIAKMQNTLDDSNSSKSSNKAKNADVIDSLLSDE